jgi:hypothetical protein
MLVRQKTKVTAFLLLLALGTTRVAEAGDTILYATPQKSMSGNARHVYIHGAYAIGAGETIADVRLFFSIQDNFGRIVSGGQVQGNYYPLYDTWDVGYGDYQLYSYYAVVTVQKGTVKTKYFTPTFYW